jgi:acyl-CoA reductase-like NAD-dependent aldehyde dehydrogenase
MIEHDTLYIGGTHEKPSSAERIEVRSPFTEEIVGRVPAASTADVDRAVTAARAAFEDGPGHAPHQPSAPTSSTASWPRCNSGPATSRRW